MKSIPLAREIMSRVSYVLHPELDVLEAERRDHLECWDAAVVGDAADQRFELRFID